MKLCNSKYSIVDTSIWSSINLTLFAALQIKKEGTCLRNCGLRKKIRSVNSHNITIEKIGSRTFIE